MRILFMGTPEFSVPCFRALLDHHYPVVGVVTQPDKPKGRGHRLTPPPVKEAAVAAGVPIYQPETLKNGAFSEQLAELDPELIVVVAYGKILPRDILDFPRYGCINVHASLLPKYRGAGPIQWAVIHGEKETGVTTMYMEEGLDTGDMLLRAVTPISETETAGELHDRLSKMGAEVLLQTLEELKTGTLKREKQEEALSSYAPMMKKETGKIDWTDSAEKIHCLVRGTNPWPVAYTLYNEVVWKIYKTEICGITAGQPGQIIDMGKNGIDVACGDGKILRIMEMQQKGGKQMSAASFLNGHQLDAGVVLK